jgi:very-short-patch-repair endonuclease
MSEPLHRIVPYERQCAKSDNLTDIFIEKSKKKHGDKYDYYKSKYEHNLKEVIIICPEHGEFSQTPKVHKRGGGCQDCGRIKSANGRKSNTYEFIEDATKIHGNTYDYSKVEYKSAREYVTIICREHGEFTIAPNSHLSKKIGCRRCGIMKITNTKEFIEEAQKIHGNTYDYSKVEYKTSMKPVTLICKTHGDFQIRPNGHISSEAGCFKCGHNMKIFSTNEFIEEAQQIHGDTYDYSNVVYSKMTGKVKIICRNCNEEFEQTASNHITHRQGCSCFKKKTETKLHDALKQIYSTIIKEFKKSWCKNKRYLPFDFCIPELKIIIELDGLQHFDDVKFFKSSFTERHEIDIYKEKCANDNGYHTIRILQEDVLYDKNDWLENLLREIEYIKINQYDIHRLYICDDNEYVIFMES